MPSLRVEPGSFRVELTLMCGGTSRRNSGSSGPSLGDPRTPAGRDFSNIVQRTFAHLVSADSNCPSNAANRKLTHRLELRVWNTRPSWKNHLRWPESPTLPPMKSGPTAVSASKPAATSLGRLLSAVTPYILPISYAPTA